MAAIDKELLTWVKKKWAQHGKRIAEIEIRHVKMNGAIPQLVHSFSEFTQFASDELLAKTLEEECIAHARMFSGMVTFEIAAYAEGNKPLGVCRVRKRGEAEEDPDTGELPPGERGTLRMYQQHEQIMFKETNSTLTGLIQILEKQNDRLLKQLADKDDMIQKLIADYPQLVDLMGALGDRSVERDIKRNSAARVDAMKQRAWDTIEKKILPELMGGGVSSLAPKLETLVKGLIAEPERAMQIAMLLKPEERVIFGELTAAFEEPEPPAKVENVVQPNGAG